MALKIDGSEYEVLTGINKILGIGPKNENGFKEAVKKYGPFPQETDRLLEEFQRCGSMEYVTHRDWFMLILKAVHPVVNTKTPVFEESCLKHRLYVPDCLNKCFLMLAPEQAAADQSKKFQSNPVSTGGKKFLAIQLDSANHVGLFIHPKQILYWDFHDGRALIASTPNCIPPAYV